MNDEIKIAENPYEILGVARDASKEEIIKAFRRQVKRYHPDRGDDGDSAFYIKVVEAFNILKNPKTRKQYDKAGKIKRKETNRHNAAIKNCQTMFINSIDSWAVNNPDFDIFEALVDNVEKNIVRSKDNIKSFKADVKRVKAIRARIKPKNKNGTEMLFRGVLTDRIYGREEDIERQLEEIEIGKIMIKMFKDVELSGVKRIENYNEPEEYFSDEEDPMEDCY